MSKNDCNIFADVRDPEELEQLFNEDYALDSSFTLQSIAISALRIANSLDRIANSLEHNLARSTDDGK